MEFINYPIKPEKGQAWHNRSHPYFTKQPSNVVAHYIEHYSKKGDTVLDPFGGTGVTAIEALRLGRKAVIIDINPLLINDRYINQILYICSLYQSFTIKPYEKDSCNFPKTQNYFRTNGRKYKISS